MRIIKAIKYTATILCAVAGRWKKNKKEEKDVHDFLYTELEESMKQILGSKVSIKNKKNNKGKIEIEYYSRDELERIVDMIRSI